MPWSTPPSAERWITDENSGLMIENTTSATANTTAKPAIIPSSQLSPRKRSR